MDFESIWTNNQEKMETQFFRKHTVHLKHIFAGETGIILNQAAENLLLFDWNQTQIANIQDFRISVLMA